MNVKSDLIGDIYLVTLLILIVVFAAVGNAYALSAVVSLAVIKQLGRINTSLTRMKHER